MTAIIIIIIITVILYFLFWKKTDDNSIAVSEDDKNEKANPIEASEAETLDESEIFTDENGQYKLVEKNREIPRRTFIKAYLNGKYWGEIDEHFSNQFQQSVFYDLNIYEVSLKNAIYGNVPFQLEQDLRIPREKLPKLLHTVLEKYGKEYEVNLHEPVFADIKFNRKLHQNDGNEVFGTINAVVTGYILDFTKEIYFEKEYIVPINEIIPVPQIEKPVLAKTNTPTGNVEIKGDYKRTEYYYSDSKKTYWSDWKYQKSAKTSNNEGCFSTFIGILSGIFFIAFILMLLPQIAFILPFFLILFLLNIIPAKVYDWLFKILGLLILLGFIIGLLQFFNHNSNNYSPKPIVTDRQEEVKPKIEPMVDTVNHQAIKDTLIIHYRKWQDYEGNSYEGKFWTRKSDYLKSRNFKQNFSFPVNTERDYDSMIHSLKENDKEHLGGIYQLFDGIQKEQHLSRIKFAELIVSFIQDISYTLILPDDCSPNLYDDQFIKEYLNSKNAKCDGLEKFGINTPVEFMSTLNGDCDTRTLLLYTMLAHYDYDVALFSSEYYNHSLIGINLPISGITYQYQNQRYVLWETTAPNIKPGIIPKEISNLNYWRISLKSK